MSPSARDLNWIDGLRGIASALVVCGHLCTAFAPWIHSPASEGEYPSLIQLPYFRLCVGGRSGVALFFIITGYVNALNAISRSRSGNAEAAFLGISKSALARSGRLILPATVATIISWTLANMNAYKMAEHIDAVWIRQGFHDREPNIVLATVSLVRAIISTWTTGWNEYDGTQWTLVLFLQGSVLVYVVMLATIPVTQRARRMILVVLYLYFWACGDALKGMNIIVGMFLAELQVEFGMDASSVLPCAVPSLMIVMGMFMCCYPQDAVENARWSIIMRDIMLPLAPHEADLRRFWDSLGATTVVLGVFFHERARQLLCSDIFNFLGRVSFPVYLLHNQLMKSLLTWLVYFPSAMAPPLDDNGDQLDLQRGSMLHMALAITVYYLVLYRLGYFWVQYIDPVCAGVVQKLIKWAYGEGARSERTLIPISIVMKTTTHG